jgi:hypothetical protein
MERRITEEQLTKAILEWLIANNWEIICYDFPQSGTGVSIHPNEELRTTKNKGAIIPDIVAIKNGTVKAYAFGSTFAFFADTQTNAKKCKRATKPTHQDKHEMTTNIHDRKEGRSANSGLAKVAVQCSADSFVVNQKFVLSINICGEKL